jgi:hypothetical protein
VPVRCDCVYKRGSGVIGHVLVLTLVGIGGCAQGDAGCRVIARGN